MRHLMILALSALVALSWSPDAEASKKGKKGKKSKGENVEQVDDAGEEDEAGGLEILETGLADVDSVFGKAKTPVETITNTRLGLDRLTADLNAALGLAEGTPIADALEDLKSKAEGKLSVAMGDGALPKVSAEDGVPENVDSAINALNSGLDELSGLIASLGELPEQFTALAEECQKFTDMGTLKGMASNPVQAGKALPKIKKNVKALGTAKNEAQDLLQSVDTLKSSLTGLGA